MHTLFVFGVGFALGGMFYMFMYERNIKKEETNKVVSERFLENRFSTDLKEGIRKTKITSEKILSNIQLMYERHGEVVVEYIDEEMIGIVAADKQKEDMIERKMVFLHEMIKEHLKDV